MATRIRGFDEVELGGNFEIFTGSLESEGLLNFFVGSQEDLDDGGRDGEGDGLGVDGSNYTKKPKNQKTKDKHVIPTEMEESM